MRSSEFGSERGPEIVMMRKVSVRSKYHGRHNVARVSQDYMWIDTHGRFEDAE